MFYTYPVCIFVFIGVLVCVFLHHTFWQFNNYSAVFVQSCIKVRVTFCHFLVMGFNFTKAIGSHMVIIISLLKVFFGSVRVHASL